MLLAGLLFAMLFFAACSPPVGPPELASPPASEIAVVRATGTVRLAAPAATELPEQPTAIVDPPEANKQATSQPLNVSLPASQGVVCSPLAAIELDELPSIISSPYEPPPAGKEDRHHGVDFSYYRRGEQASIQGAVVQAILPGVVAMALTDSFPYGNVVIVESDPAVLPAALGERLDSRAGESLYTLYAHLQEGPQFQVGQMVEACQPLGAVGMSGNAGVAHLHLETRLGPAGVSFSQMGYYLAHSTETEKENYLRWRISGDFRHFDPMTLLSPQDDAP